MVSDATACVAPLFVPADRPDRFVKAAATGADAVILDLEDGVAVNAKDHARANLSSAFIAKPILVRVNGLGTDWHAKDMAAVLSLPLAGVIVPKAEPGEAMERLAAGALGLAPVIALIETAQGLAGAAVLARIPNVVRLALGSIDLCADLGCAHTREVLLPLRSALVVASRLAGIAPPIDGVTTAIDDLAAEEDARHARDLGFGGKLCIHPRQIDGAMRGFRPTEAQITWARKVLAAPDGASLVAGEMVDAPVKARARALLARAADSASVT